MKDYKLIKKTVWPSKGEVIPLGQIREICMVFELPELARKIKADPPKNDFRSDGCSMWPDSWKGTSIYPACLIHDIKYWSGYPGEKLERFVADAELMIDVACILEEIGMAKVIFHGVRFGGHAMFRRSFSWGFGRR